MGDFVISCSAGGYKGIFIHGVLSAFEEVGFHAQAYACASSSVLPTAYAVFGHTRELGLKYWFEGLRLLQRPGIGMSDMILSGIAYHAPRLTTELFQRNRPNFHIVTSAVVNEEAADVTQGKEARRLGRKLLLESARGKSQWVNENLETVIFSTKPKPAAEKKVLPLNKQIFEQVIYASTRMLHAWDQPAWVDGKAYVDASYTCLNPAREMVEIEQKAVIAIDATPKPIYSDLFQTTVLPDAWSGFPIYQLCPDFDPEQVNVRFTRASEEGALTLYQHGVEKGKILLQELRETSR